MSDEPEVVPPRRGGPSLPRPRRRGAALLAAGLLLVPGCSLRRMAVNTLADALAESGSVYASDPDPELVRDALPFALKTFESLLASNPEHRGLLVSSCSGFTQYAYAFVEADAQRLEFADYAESRRLTERALALYLRGRDYCLHGLELDHPGIRGRLERQPNDAAAELEGADLDLLYWTAAAWGSAISVGVHRLDIVADLPAVRALLRRGLALDESYDHGALHQALIGIEALPAAMGGSRERAEEHFRRAVELTGGHSAAPFVTFASSVLVPAQERAAFRRELERALAVDVDVEPSLHLVNALAQQRARFLLDHADDLFLEPLQEEEGS
jgi:predicted anti-sigma-YlaC factor YlaD